MQGATSNSNMNKLRQQYEQLESIIHQRDEQIRLLQTELFSLNHHGMKSARDSSPIGTSVHTPILTARNSSLNQTLSNVDNVQTMDDARQQLTQSTTEGETRSGGSYEEEDSDDDFERMEQKLFGSDSLVNRTSSQVSSRQSRRSPTTAASSFNPSSPATSTSNIHAEENRQLKNELDNLKRLYNAMQMQNQRKESSSASSGGPPRTAKGVVILE